MSLKNEIDKLVNAKLDKLEEADIKNAKRDEFTKQRFAPLGTVLEEICNSVDSKYLKCDFYNYGAEMQLGILKDGTWLKDTSFRIDLGEFGLDD